MGAILFIINRFLTFRTFKGILDNRCMMYFKANDLVIKMFIENETFSQYFDGCSCNLGESFSMRASLNNVSYHNNTLIIENKIIKDVVIIDKEEYDRLYEEYPHFLQLAKNEIRKKEEVLKNIEFKNNIEKLVNNEPIFQITHASVFTKLLHKTFNKYDHKTFEKNGYGGYSIYDLNVDKDFKVMDYSPNSEEILHSMKRYVSNVMEYSKETDNELVIEINNILNKSK